MNRMSGLKYFGVFSRSRYVSFIIKNYFLSVYCDKSDIWNLEYSFNTMNR